MEIAQSVAGSRAFAADLFDTLRRDSLDGDGVTRDPYGAGEERAHLTVEHAARRLHLAVERDAAANLYMTWPGRSRAARRVIIGSHLDSVPNGGNFDGAAGVVAGLVAVDALKRMGRSPSCDITLMAIRAEESVWFEVSYIGSRAALGTLPPAALQAPRRDTQRPLWAHMADCGGDPNRLHDEGPQLHPETIRAFLEVHIEQAPSLVEAGCPVGICTGIPGTFRLPQMRIEGEYDHVGLPRRFRRDAALAGAEFFAALDAAWGEHEARGVPMACTVGRFHTDPAAHGMTRVAGEFHLSLDLRAYDPDVLRALERRADAIIEEVERRRGVRFRRGVAARVAPGVVDAKIRGALEGGASRLGIPARPLPSPASHDAAAFAACGVPTGMIFVRNRNGSHNPREAMETDDFMQASTLLTWWLAEHVC